MVNVYGRVLVDLRRETFHASKTSQSASGAEHWCAGAAAYRSRLQPCSACASGHMRAFSVALGRLRSGTRKSLGLPHLWLVEGRFDHRDVDPADTVADADVPYGAPDDQGDPRFAAQSSVGWGTASYGQDPDEYLGDATDDDNDWRGGGARYLD